MTLPPLLLDAGVGYRLPYPTAEANLTCPDKVLALHRAHVRAGAEVILTNTFGCPDLPVKIRAKALEAGVKIGKKAAGKKAWVLGSLGPSRDAKALAACARKLATFGVSGIVFETFFTRASMEEVLTWAPALAKKIPLVLSMTVNDEGYLLDGTSPLSLITQIEDAGFSVVGFNCSKGPLSLLKPVSDLAPLTTLPIWVKPNAGLPPYAITPEVFARQMKKLVKAGARLIGGCCGTHARHIFALRKLINLPNIVSESQHPLPKDRKFRSASHR